MLRFTWVLAVVALLVAGCPGPEGPVTCQDAIRLQYDSGCTLQDAEGEPKPIEYGLEVCAIIERQVARDCPHCSDLLEAWAEDLAAYQCVDHLGEDGTPQPREVFFCCPVVTDGGG